MNTSTDSESIEQEASRWFARRKSDTWSEVEQVQFEAWLGQHTAHEIAYVRLEAAWARSDRMRVLGAGVPKGVIPPRWSWGGAGSFKSASPQTEPPPARDASSNTSENFFKRDRRVPGPRIIALAAALLACVVAGIYILEADLFGGTHYATTVGDMENVVLADGSRITLNTDTSIRVALTGNERRIRLDKGEAFFEVAKDKTRPFVVYVGDKRVVAIGTQFSVRRDNDDVRVVVTEGRVSLASATIPASNESGGATGRHHATHDVGAGPGSVLSNPPSLFLNAGAIARTSKADVLVRPDATVEVEKLLSWRKGYIVFDNTTLADAVAEFNRYTGRKIFIEDPAIAAIRIGGNFRATNVDAFLWLLQSGFPITLEQSEDRVVLKAR